MEDVERVRPQHIVFDGRQGFYEHDSASVGGPMRFAVYLPPAAVQGEKVPALYYLARKVIQRRGTDVSLDYQTTFDMHALQVAIPADPAVLFPDRPGCKRGGFNPFLQGYEAG